MLKSKAYPRAFFPRKALTEASAVLEQRGNELRLKRREPLFQRLVLQIDRERWEHETEEEFFADYGRNPREAVYGKRAFVDGALTMHFHNGATHLEVELPSRPAIEAVFAKFEEYEAEATLLNPPATEAKIFIGHGHSPLWRDLKDHLSDKHHYDVIAYEVGARAGHAVRDILEDMLNKSSIAFLVLTGEDETVSGVKHARANVIHETGLFQGSLGFSRAIVLLEEGTNEFSNLHGIEQIRFSKGNIKETFGEVVAVIRREFD